MKNDTPRNKKLKMFLFRNHIGSSGKIRQIILLLIFWYLKTFVYSDKPLTKKWFLRRGFKEQNINGAVYLSKGNYRILAEPYHIKEFNITNPAFTRLEINGKNGWQDYAADTIGAVRAIMEAKPIHMDDTDIMKEIDSYYTKTETLTDEEKRERKQAEQRGEEAGIDFFNNNEKLTR